MTSPAASATEAYRQHGRLLWGIGYRMLGSASEADDVVQETFVRALERPPSDPSLPMVPWLIRVTMNLSRDALRRRKRRRYVGPWLPSLVETPEGSRAAEGDPPTFEPVDGKGDPEARYDLLESVSLAFLVALEELSPTQRAVLLLCDVFDYSVRETAAALEMSESNVKTTHHRVRARMARYDANRCPSVRERRERTEAALAQFLACLGARDRGALSALLADQARALSDGGGEFFAARVPVVGSPKVAQFFLKLAAQFGDAPRLELRSVNGLPAVIADIADPPSGIAPRSVTQVEVDRMGRIVGVYTVLARAKLAGIR